MIFNSNKQMKLHNVIILNKFCYTYGHYFLFNFAIKFLLYLLALWVSSSIARRAAALAAAYEIIFS